ncbi:hypothetical protein PHISCL_06780 [Aspergillus sclerotialis]|uniref:Uncharacterized protein n=1 Tax=Aspergillus sclerotialis TaxID=2070753 RepID=A0A3A2ZNF5_9EURO|nr:hypothetical protein PHISCL_06780 [Aspergillus sclerotialis]
MPKVNSKLVDIEPGGESTQYESIRTVTKSPPKQTGQLGAHSEHTKSEIKTHDFEGKPEKSYDEDELAQKLGNRGKPDYSLGVKDNVETQDADAAVAKTRGQQRYGPGSGVGA